MYAYPAGMSFMLLVSVSNFQNPIVISSYLFIILQTVHKKVSI